MSLARRSLSSISWSAGTNWIGTAVAVARSIWLARLLPVEVFGIYEGMRAVIDVTITVTDFGLTSAFLHRTQETEDEDTAAAVHFTLKTLLTGFWALVLSLGVLLWASPDEVIPYLALILGSVVFNLTQTARAIMARRVVHRRMALLGLMSTVLATIPALALAYAGFDLWSVISIDIFGMLMSLVGLYLWKPVWRPHFGWYPQVIRYFLSFGLRSFAATVLNNLLDRVDDLWTRFYLGDISLGYYSRAYGFATRPRMLIAGPVISVIGGTYAELKYDRLRLSQAFFRTNAFLIRSGFFLAGWLLLIAPEFIRIFLTEKWMPMLSVYRLMLVFTLLDPVKQGITGVFGAVGVPEKIVYIRGIQLVILTVGMVGLSVIWGIEGVAMAVTLMLVIGIGLSLWQVRRYVDYSLQALFLKPTLAILLALALGQAVSLIPEVQSNDWLSGIFKTAIYSIVYLIFLWMTERSQLRRVLSQLPIPILSRYFHKWREDELHPGD